MSKRKYLLIFLIHSSRFICIWGLSISLCCFYQ